MVPMKAQLPLTATPVDRTLVMRALGGAITSPCSNVTGSRRPTLTIFELSPHLFFNFQISDWTRQSNGTLWETASTLLCLFLACTVATTIQNNLHRVLFS